MSEIFRLEAPFRSPFILERLTYGEGGPSVAIVAGLHGHELDGIHAVNLVIRTIEHTRLRGTVHILPVVNSFGVDQGTKRWPFDDRDINQSFPGDPAGASVQRVAHALLEATDAEVCVDVHSGSSVLREIPQARVPLTGTEVELARAMALPLLWRRAEDRMDATGLVGAWRNLGRKSIHVVGGRAGTLDKSQAALIADGLLRLLAHMGILPSEGTPARSTCDVTRAGVSYHYSSVGGFFVPEVRVGDRVAPGHLLGSLREVVGGGLLEEVRADRSGIVVSLRAYPVVHGAELLARVAETRA